MQTHIYFAGPRQTGELSLTHATGCGIMKGKEDPPLKPDSGKRFLACTRRVYFFWNGTYTFLGGPPAPPQTPLLVPPPGQKGCQSAPISNRHPSAHSSRPEIEALQSYGGKTEIRTHAHVTYKAPITGLHSPTLLPFLKNSTISNWHFL